MHRRDFLTRTGSCAAHLALAAGLPAIARRDWLRPRGRVVARRASATLERIADGIWAVISNPQDGDRATLSNGGLIAGTDGILAIEGFLQPEGAAWLAAQCRALTGRLPTHVAVTHYHADHANGLAGYFTDGAGPLVLTTAVTRDLVLARNTPATPERTAAFGDVRLLAADRPETVDLGGRRVTITPRDGHTPSDVSLAVDDPHVVFCGDLVWTRFFPNYVDARPLALRRAAAALRGEPGTVYVPGHGTLAHQAGFDGYIDLLDAVEAGARRAFDAGEEAEAAGSAFSLPASLGDWTFFGRTYLPRAFSAWYRDLAGS